MRFSNNRRLRESTASVQWTKAFLSNDEHDDVRVPRDLLDVEDVDELEFDAQLWEFAAASLLGVSDLGKLRIATSEDSVWSRSGIIDEVEHLKVRSDDELADWAGVASIGLGRIGSLEVVEVTDGGFIALVARKADLNRLRESAADLSQKRYKYQINFSGEAVFYNDPSYFKIPRDEDGFKIFSGSQCREYQGTLLEYWTDNAARASKLRRLGIEVLNVQVERVGFDVEELVSRAADFETDDHRTPENFGDCFDYVRGDAEMPYAVAFVITTAKPLSKEATDWLCEDAGSVIWGQYFDDGSGLDISVNEVWYPNTED
jgi:hypothetical protein